MHTHTHTQGYCVYMFTDIINDDIQTGICIDIDLCYEQSLLQDNKDDIYLLYVFEEYSVYLKDFINYNEYESFMV